VARMGNKKRVCDTCRTEIDGYELCLVCWQGIVVSEGFVGVLDLLPDLYREEGEKEESEHDA